MSNKQQQKQQSGRKRKKGGLYVKAGAIPNQISSPQHVHAHTRKE